ncbi:MAG: hypothetical protein NT169_25175 [Chloroflexi bacterium]|nr:hypothetical protein [Chloroflexota bacterium]
MSVLNRIAFFQGRRDEVPNQALARELAAARDAQGIREIADNLWHRDSNIRSDCLKVLYEAGYLAPDLIADYVTDFLRLLKDKNNRMVWGGMIALSTIAQIKAQEIAEHFDDITRVMAAGSVITVDAGVGALAMAASTGDERRAKLLPYLLNHLSACRPGDVPRHAEKILVAVDAETRQPFVAVLEKRMAGLSDAQLVRVRKVMREAQTR